MARNWAELPRGLLGKILKRLCTTSIFSVKIVCQPWYSAVQEEANLSLLHPVPSPPWLTIPGETEEDSSTARFFSPAYNKVYSIANNNNNNNNKRKISSCPPSPPLTTKDEEARCVGSSHGWLAFIDCMCNIYLTNPFKPYEPSIQLPSIETLPCIIGVGKSSSSSGIEYIIKYEDDMVYNTWSHKLYWYIITKLVMSSPSSSSGEYTVMAIYGELYSLAFCKSGDTSWTPLNHDSEWRYTYEHSELYYSSNDNKFYAYGAHGFEIWDLRDSSSPKHTYISSLALPPDHTPRRRRKMYLVELCGDVLMAVKLVAEDGQVNYESVEDDALTYPFPYRTFSFKLYKLDWEKKQWVQVQSLGGGNRGGDSVLFVGINNAMTCSASDFPGLKGNSIYFTDDYFIYRRNFRMRDDSYKDHPNRELTYGGHDLGIFSLEDNSIQPCYSSGDFKKISPPPVWISPNPCW